MDVQSPNTRSIFEHALELPEGGERRAYLDDACAGRPELRTQVESLLKAHGDAGSFLDGPAFDGQRTSPMEPMAERPGTTIGSYKLLEQIGEGGFGVVFMAEQQQPVRRKVALKLLKPGMDSRQVLARFEAERQALAIMDHENIAKVFDGGMTDSGRPYFVMELVKGEPITEYCDRNQLSPRQRLELFMQVCHAVQHAHTKGIIHRDIKPTNVLVPMHDTRPVVKVIDFGVAKALGQTLTDKTLFTGFAQFLGTPLYMSPEQAGQSSLDIDTRSDIYSLGVLLYELLTGTTPFDKERFRKAAEDEVRRIIREEEPDRPSTRLSTMGEQARSISALARGKSDPKQLHQLVRGELDWIVMKALEKDRSRRYETASAFAADVQHYLEDEPVEACPPSAIYRIHKFARRNKGPALVGALVLLTLVGGIIGTTHGLIRAQQAQRAEATRAEGEARANEAAQAREAEANAVVDFFDTKVLAAGWPVGDGVALGYDVTLRRAIETAVPLVEQSFTDQPLIEARLRLMLGKWFLYQHDAKLAAEQLSAARLMYSRNLGPDHIDTLKSMHYLAKSFDFLDRPGDAAKLRDEVLALRKAKLGVDHPDTLESMHHQATSYLVLGRSKEALALYEEALAGRKRVLGPHHRDTLWSMNGVANTYESLGRNAEALKLHEETFALRKAKLGADHPDTLQSMYHIANVQTALGRHAEALTLRELTLAKRKAVEGADHPDTLASMSSLAFSYATAGRYDDAINLREQEVALRKVKLGPDHPDTLRAVKILAACYRKRGTLLRQGSHFRDAATDFEKVTDLDPGDHLNLYEAAALFLYIGDVEHYRHACAEMLDRFEGPSEDTPEIAIRVATACALAPHSVSDFSRAERLAQRGTTATAVHNPDRWSFLAKGLTEYRAGHHQKAVEWLNRFGPRADGTHCDGSGFAILAMAHHQLGDSGAARASLDAARAILAKRPKDAMHGWGWRDWLHAEILIREAEDLISVISAQELASTTPTSEMRALDLNNRAWTLATSLDVPMRDPHGAVELAQEAVKLAPKAADYWNTLGVAQYRDGNWKDAISSLQKYRELRTNDEEGWNPFFLAMAHWKLGNKDEARQWYDKGAQWMDNTPAMSEALNPIRDEATELLGANEKK